MVAGWAAQMCLSVSCSADWTVGTAGVVVKKNKKSPPSFDGSQGCSGAAPKSLTTDACKWAHGPTPPSAQEDEIDHSEKKKNSETHPVWWMYSKAEATIKGGKRESSIWWYVDFLTGFSVKVYSETLWLTT